MATKFEKYGVVWPFNNPVLIEIACILKGGIWKVQDKLVGKGMAFHKYALSRLLWPEDQEHRWEELALKTLAENPITCFLGPASSAKTHYVAKDVLMDYWCRPKESLALVTTTTSQANEMKIWGRLKELFGRAQKLWPAELAGNVIDSKMTITTDKVDKIGQKATRVMTRGIVCINCPAGERQSGISGYIGIKQKYITLVGDELQFVGSSILGAVPNLSANPNFQARFMGNPTDPYDPLGMASEPLAGWNAMPVPTKTTTWKSKYMDAVVVNFVGTDSPNFDYPETEPDKFKFLVGRRHIKQIGGSSGYGYESNEFRQMCLGVMWTGALKWRVVTRDMAIQHGAKDPVVWKGETRRKIGSLDAAFSGIGGDRCVWAIHEFGEDINGKHVFLCGEPEIFKIVVRPDKTAEDQIAELVKERSSAAGLPASGIFYDSSMRGTLGYAFARVFGAVVPVPIEFGGKPTTRPVRHDLYVTDPMTHQPRHKRCDEHYSKFVTELWFSARYIIECDQMSGLSEDVLMELCLREYREVAGNKVEVESKSDKKAKERMGRSPDLADNLVCGIEGARQRGFRIERLGALLLDTPNGLPKWLIEAESFARKHRESRRLIRA